MAYERVDQAVHSLLEEARFGKRVKRFGEYLFDVLDPLQGHTSHPAVIQHARDISHDFPTAPNPYIFYALPRLRIDGGSVTVRTGLESLSRQFTKPEETREIVFFDNHDPDVFEEETDLLGKLDSNGELRTTRGPVIDSETLTSLIRITNSVAKSARIRPFDYGAPTQDE